MSEMLKCVKRNRILESMKCSISLIRIFEMINEFEKPKLHYKTYFVTAFIIHSRKINNKP